MSEEQIAAPAPEAPAAEAPESFSTASEAAAFLARHAAAKRKSGEPNSGEAPAVATAEESEVGQPAEDTDPPQEVPGEQTEEADPAEMPTIEPPRSWTKAEKEEFATYPREAQEKIARREQEREAALRRGQNEIAEQRKAIDAKAREAEQQRQDYEARLPAAVSATQAVIAAEFPDVQSYGDLRRMAAEDPARYAQWEIRQKELAHWQSEAQAAQQRQQQEGQAKLQSWRDAQDQEFEQYMASVPKAERTALANEAKQALIDYGLTEDQIADLWNNSILRSAAAQRMMADAARYRIAKRGAAKPASKPVPPVQKPGTAGRAPNRALESQIAALEAKPSLSLKEATQLLSLKGQRRPAA